jgi:hypothetical protein
MRIERTVERIKWNDATECKPPVYFMRGGRAGGSTKGCVVDGVPTRDDNTTRSRVVLVYSKEHGERTGQTVQCGYYAWDEGMDVNSPRRWHVIGVSSHYNYQVTHWAAIEPPGDEDDAANKI